MELAEKLIEVVPAAMQAMRDEMRARRSDLDLAEKANRTYQESVDGLSLPQFRILARLVSEPQTNKALAEYLGLSVAATSRSVDGLIALRLLEKKQSRRDRREVRIQASAAGRKMFDAVRTKIREEMANRLSKLKPDDQKKLEAGLDVLAQAFASDL